MYDPVLEYSEFIVQRLKGNGPPPERAMLRTAQIFAHELSIPPLQYDLESAFRIELSETELAKRMEQLNHSKKLGRYKACGLMNDPIEPSAYLIWRRKFLSKSVEEIAFTMPEQTSLNPFLKAVEQICLEFEAFYAYVYDSSLSQLHGRAMRVYERSLAQLPPERHQFLLKPEPIEGAVDVLYPLLLKDEFDFVHVPDGVWWVNYWSPLQVETVGLEQIKTANWDRLIELPNGGLILVVTKEPLDVTNAAHMAKVGELVEHLNLRQLQEHYRTNC